METRMNPVNLIRTKVQNPRGADHKFTARCPSHEDNRNSLSVGEGDDGRAMLHCFAGCTTEDVINALGLEMKNLFASNNTSGQPRSSRSGNPEAVSMEAWAAKTGISAKFWNYLGVAHHQARHEQHIRILIEQIDLLERDNVDLEARVTLLEGITEELTPRNEFGYTQEQCWAMTRSFHMLQHKECPLFTGDTDGCKGFASKWHSWEWRDYIEQFLAMAKTVEAIKYLMPTADRAALRDIMREPADAGGAESLAALSGR